MIKITIPLVAIFGIAAVFYFRGNLSEQHTAQKILSPFGNAFSIFSYLSEDNKKPKKIIYGYLPYWSLDDAKYIQPDKITDIAYFGLYINGDGSFKDTLEDGSTEPGLANWLTNEDLDSLIKTSKNYGIRFSLTIISHEDKDSTEFLECRNCWDTLLSNIIKELDRKGIRDLNLNFEYGDEVEPELALKYTELVKFINEELDKKYGNSFVVTSTFADSMVKKRITEIEGLGKAADMLFIMAYDFHRPNSDNAGPVSPIDGKGVHAEYDIRTTINDYLTKVHPAKIILGVPYYGYNWVVTDTKPNSERIPGTDDIGFSQSQAYWQIMDTVLETKPEIKWDELGQVPYFTYTSLETGSTRQVYYENDKSLQLKYDLIFEHNLAGVGIWAIGYDGGYQELWDLLGKNFVGR